MQISMGVIPRMVHILLKERNLSAILCAGGCWGEKSFTVHDRLCVWLPWTEKKLSHMNGKKE